MTTIVQRWTKTVTIGGIVTPCLTARTDFGTDQPVGTASLTLPLPLGAHVVAGADVTIAVALDGVALAQPLFTGTLRSIDEQSSTSGRVATLGCEGPCYKLTYPLEQDLAFAGGARAADQPLFSSPVHLGTRTVSWYEVHAPTGTHDDIVVTPLANSDFVWVKGIHHGSNSYETSTDKKTKDWSRIEVWQGGVRLGYGNLPVSGERWSDTLDYTDHTKWDSFEVFVACYIRTVDGDVTFKFVSGTEPGTSTRDELELDDVTWQTAGLTSIRDFVRALFRRAGFAVGTYIVAHAHDLDGNIVYLGGNGLVAAGQVVLGRHERPLDVANRIANEFGYVVVDAPNGVPRMIPFRGLPTNTLAATFTETVNSWNFRAVHDPKNVYNSVRVEGASGTDQDKKKFAYVYQTPTADVVANPDIPNPPKAALLPFSDSLLVTQDLVEVVGAIQETNHSEEALSATWDTWPQALAPGQTVHATSATEGIDDDLFVQHVSHDLGASGFVCHLTGWRGAAHAFSEEDDPDPDEIPLILDTPRPADEWRAYRLSAAVNP